MNPVHLLPGRIRCRCWWSLSRTSEFHQPPAGPWWSSRWCRRVRRRTPPWIWLQEVRRSVRETNIWESNRQSATVWGRIGTDSGCHCPPPASGPAQADRPAEHRPGRTPEPPPGTNWTSSSLRTETPGPTAGQETVPKLWSAPGFIRVRIRTLDLWEQRSGLNESNVTQFIDPYLVWFFG